MHTKFSRKIYATFPGKVDIKQNDIRLSLFIKSKSLFGTAGKIEIGRIST